MPSQFIKLIFSPKINAPIKAIRIELIESHRIVRIAMPLTDNALKNKSGSREYIAIVKGKIYGLVKADVLLSFKSVIITTSRDAITVE